MVIRIDKMLKIAALELVLVLGLSSQMSAQEAPKDAKPAETKSGDLKPPESPVPKEESSVTDHTILIGGQTIPYKSTASTTLLKNDKHRPPAGTFSFAH